MKIKNIKFNGKKLVSLLLAGTFVVTTLTGCTKATKEEKEVEETTAAITTPAETEVINADAISFVPTNEASLFVTDEKVSIREPEQTAVSYVYEDNIIGDIYLESDRSEARQEESDSLEALFTNKTSRDISVNTINEVVELSDALNGYNPGPNEYSNTSYSNVVSFDPQMLYYRYKNILASGDEEALASFCEEQMVNEANVDAWVTFGCGTVANAIEKRLINLVTSRINPNGKQIVSTVGKATDNGFTIVINYDGTPVKVNVTGEFAAQLAANYTDLQRHFNIALDNVAGINGNENDKGYENSFAQNGVYIGHENDSVFLSIGDDYKKEDLKQGIAYANTLTSQSLDYSFDRVNDNTTVSYDTKTTLQALGYTDEEISRTIELTLSLQLQQTLTK